MNHIKISVIMAVYNAQATVERMLKSLQAQTLADFEIIIVDDGSTDGSGEICDRYAAEDHRIRVIHQTNRGVSASRQVGFDAAEGDFIIHADADDFTEPAMLENLYNKAIDEKADVVFSDFYIDKADGTSALIKQEPPYNTSEALIAILKRLHGNCWNKLAKRSTLLKHNVKFPVGLNYCEDLLTWVQLFQHPEVCISYVDKAFYHYVVNNNSLTQHGSLAMLNNIKLFTRKITELLPKGIKEIDDYIETLPIAPFQYAFRHHLVSNAESRAEYKRIRTVAWNDTKSLKGKLGYLCMDLNLMPIARFLMKL